jgi:hypothetical protein
MFANWPPLGLFHVQIFGGAYSDESVIVSLQAPGARCRGFTPPAGNSTERAPASFRHRSPF